MGNARFKTKNQAMQMAIHVWTCEHCGTQHKKKKPMVCQNCGVGAFYHFDSVGEANKFAELAMLQNAGKLSDLRLQVPFPIYFDVIGGMPVLTTQKRGKAHRTYYADFVYVDGEGHRVVLDYKGSTSNVTDVFKLKRKDVEILYGFKIVLV